MNYPAVLDKWMHKHAFCLFCQTARQKYHDCLARFPAWPDYFSYSASIYTVLDDQLTPLAAGSFFLLTLVIGLPSGWTAMRIDAAKELRAARLRAEQASDAKSLFLAVASHELRTLLYGMLASVELIGKTRLDETQAGLSAALASSAHMLKDMLNNTLDFTRSENQAVDVDRHPFDLRGEIEATVLAFGARASLKGLQLHCRIDPALAGLWWGDSLKLTQILNNFLNNALKFTARGSIALTADLIGAAAGKDAEKQQIALSVRDTGPGIADGDIDGIFSLFGQARHSGGGASVSGAGLGLYICKRFAAAMGGVIELESTLSVGSVFTLRLALQRAGEPAAAATAPAAAIAVLPTTTAVVQQHSHPFPPPTLHRAQRGTPLHLLVVDDQPISRLLLEQQLRYFGCRVTTAANGAEALAHEQRFDAILTDLNMPGQDGYTLTRIWRASGIGCPIFAISADHSIEKRERCLAAGMNDYLVKPFALDDLGALLRQYFGERVGDADCAGHVGLAMPPAATAAPTNGLPRWDADIMRIAVSALTLDLGELAECIAAVDIARLGRVVHRIHGGMAMLEMRPAAALCLAIEESIAFEWEQEALQMAPLLRDMLAQIRDDIDPDEAALEAAQK